MESPNLWMKDSFSWIDLVQKFIYSPEFCCLPRSSYELFFTARVIFEQLLLRRGIIDLIRVPRFQSISRDYHRMDSTFGSFQP